jgi:hypothetical protein
LEVKELTFGFTFNNFKELFPSRFQAFGLSPICLESGGATKITLFLSLSSVFQNFFFFLFSSFLLKRLPFLGLPYGSSKKGCNDTGDYSYFQILIKIFFL